MTYIDDYAHLPTEVAAAIAAANQGPWRRVIVVFQPHRYTRTASIGPQFADAFSAADTLVLTDVYPAGETPIPGVSGRLILHAVLDHHPELAVAYLPRPADLAVVPERYARPGDLVLTLGAERAAANEQERAQVGQLTQKVQEVTGQAVELAYVDQGYTGETPAAEAVCSSRRAARYE